MPGITIRSIRARQPELYFEYICFDRYMRLDLTEKGKNDKEISKLQTVMKTYKRKEIILTYFSKVALVIIENGAH